MTQGMAWRTRFFLFLAWLKGFRYIKFGLVGASGTLVNIGILYLAQEFLFAAINAPRSRLYASLALAIAIATLNNFTWNRLWTWSDRLRANTMQTPPIQPSPPQPGQYWLQFGRYAWRRGLVLRCNMA